MLGLSAVSVASAAIVVPEPLDLSNLDANNRPNGWTHVLITNPLVDVLDVGGTDYLRIARNPDNLGSAALFWNGNAALADVYPEHLDADGRIKNSLSGSVVLRSTSTTSTDPWGVLLGAVSKTWTSLATTNHRGYYLGLIPNTPAGGGGLGIWYNHLTTTTSTGSNTLTDAWAPLSSTLSANTDYLLEFSVSGPVISGSLFALDVNGDKTGSALVSVSHTEDDPVFGYFGLQGGRYGNTRTRYFRDLELTVIPEPTSLALLAASGLVFLVQRRRRRR